MEIYIHSFVRKDNVKASKGMILAHGNLVIVK